MLTITKKQYPNLYFLLRAGTFDELHKVNTLCQVVNYALAGILVITFGVFILTRMFLIPMLSALASVIIGESVLPVAQLPLLFLGLFWWLCLLWIFGASIAKGFKHKYQEHVLVSKLRLKRTPRKPNLFVEWYKGLKEKYCPMVVVSENDEVDDERN